MRPNRRGRVDAESLLQGGARLFAPIKRDAVDAMQLLLTGRMVCGAGRFWKAGSLGIGGKGGFAGT